MTRRDPHRQTRRALELLAERPPDRPVLLVAHYVPPHEPYQPPQRFDLFTDPSYAGPVTGRGRVLRAVRAGRLRIDDTDIAQMIALYDGNLRFADDAVGALLAGLEEQGLLRDAVILVTADHGEAFFEHGSQGHNSTLFDEMLHVPFVLRLPERYSARAPDTSRLVSLLDVAPTFLALAGATTPDWTPGFDLLAAEQQELARNRVLFHLNIGDLLAARTRSFKAITRRAGALRPRCRPGRAARRPRPAAGALPGPHRPARHASGPRSPIEPGGRRGRARPGGRTDAAGPRLPLIRWRASIRHTRSGEFPRALLRTRQDASRMAPCGAALRTPRSSPFPPLTRPFPDGGRRCQWRLSTGSSGAP